MLFDALSLGRKTTSRPSSSHRHEHRRTRCLLRCGLLARHPAAVADVLAARLSCEAMQHLPHHVPRMSFGVLCRLNEELAVARPAYPGRSWLLRARRLLPSHLPKAAVARTGTSNGGT